VRVDGGSRVAVDAGAAAAPAGGEHEHERALTPQVGEDDSGRHGLGQVCLTARRVPVATATAGRQRRRQHE
jgi:hypothetical protein